MSLKKIPPSSNVLRNGQWLKTYWTGVGEKFRELAEAEKVMAVV
jgi:hypothetical protein